MLICIVGGALQGMEAVYLAKNAGYETMVIDKRDNAPALALCDVPVLMDPVKSPEDAMSRFEECDAVIPANENADLLRALDRMMASSGIPFLFDMNAYEISSSKNLSNRMMRDIGIPIPAEWPECGFPAVIKPSCQSGSVGVRIVGDQREADAAFENIRNIGDESTAQEYVRGRNVSIEVIGDGISSRPFVTTEILLGSDHDCKRVVCAPDLIGNENELMDISERIADHIGLNGIMDVEAIDSPSGLRVLEIDARIPSQTPAAVLAATGINLLRELIDPGNGGIVRKVSSYEHFLIKDGMISTCGEKEFSKVSSPEIVKGMFGSDEMITDYVPGGKEWRVTMINSGNTEEAVDRKRTECITRIMDECRLTEFRDGWPEAVI